MAYLLEELKRTDKVKLYIVLNNGYNFLEDIKGTYPKDFSKLIRYFERILMSGVLFDETKYKHIESNIFEFKTDKVRVLCLVVPGVTPKTIILTHYHKKQKRKSPAKDIDKAKRIGKEILKSIEQGKLKLE